jgi:hypothetical protein
MKDAAYVLGRAAASALLVACVFAAAAPAGADTAQDRVRTGTGFRQNITLPTKGIEHVMFGTISRLAGPYFTLLLRTNKIVNVDASLALRSGEYSAPLFVGKIVMVTGKLDATGMLHASSVSRFMRIDEKTRPDR